MSHLSVVWIAGANFLSASEMSWRSAPIRIAALMRPLQRSTMAFISAPFANPPEIPQLLVDAPADYIKGGQSNGLMEAAVKAALTCATAGDTVLMAPACASMDQFISYADRGDRFAAAVKKLVAHE